MKKASKIVLWSLTGILCSSFLIGGVVFLGHKLISKEETIEKPEEEIKIVNNKTINDLFSSTGRWYQKTHLDKEDFSGIDCVYLSAFHSNIHLDYVDIPDDVEISTFLFDGGDLVGVKKIMFTPRENVFIDNNLIIAISEENEFMITTIADKEIKMSLDFSNSVFNNHYYQNDNSSKPEYTIEFAIGFYKKTVFSNVSSINLNFSSCYVIFGTRSFYDCKILNPNIVLNNMYGIIFSTESFSGSNVSSLTSTNAFYPATPTISLGLHAFENTELETISLTNCLGIWGSIDIPSLRELNIVDTKLNYNLLYLKFIATSDNFKLNVENWKVFLDFTQLINKNFQSMNVNLASAPLYRLKLKGLSCDPNQFQWKVRAEDKVIMKWSNLNEELLNKVIYV